MFSELFEQRSSRVITDPAEVESQLVEIGLSWRIISGSLLAGHADAAMTTDLSAASAFGFRFWDGTIGQLRAFLVLEGWSGERPGGLEVVRRADNRLQVTASLGDACVADPAGTPTPAHEKGAASRAAVADNQLTLAQVSAPHPSWDPIQTWWLLYRFVGVGDARKIVSELSLPVEMVGSRISWWDTRLVLPELPLDEVGPTVRLPAAPPEIEPDVRRRAV